MKRLLLTLTILLCLTTASAPAKSRTFYASIVPLQTEQGENFCTAWSINKKQHLYATAAHCVDPNRENMPVATISQQRVKLVLVDTNTDIAVVQGPHGVPALHLARIAPQAGDFLSVVGYPWGWTYQTTFYGRLAIPSVAIEDGHVPLAYAVFDMTAAPGNSGSPIFNVNGDVVSILQVGWDRAGSMSGGAPYSVLWTVLEPYTE